MNDLDFGLTGSTLEACFGRYTENLLNQNGIDDINLAFKELGYAGPALDYSVFSGNIEFQDTDTSLINPDGTLSGTLFFGLKTGNGGPTGVGLGTTFYRINAVNLDTFRFVPSGESSGVFYLVPGTAVPEPSTWALLLLGFGVAGGAMRQRKKASIAFA